MKLKIIRATTVPQSLNNFCKGELKTLNQKYEVVALSSPGDELMEIESREGVRVVSVPMKRRISIVKDFVSLCRMIAVIHRERPYMVHSMTPKAGLLCMVAAWVNRVPVRVHTFTGLVFPTSTGLVRKILMMTDAVTCFCATHVIPEGEGVKNDLNKYKITKKPLRVLGYGNGRGVDMDFYSRRPEVMKISETLRDDEKITFLFVGRIVGDKGINELCDAFIRIHKQYQNTRLWLVGELEDKLDPVKPETKMKINNPNTGIVAVGLKRNDDLLAYYAAADCFVLPSYREGFPNTVLEAGAMGLPSIVTDINGSREIIEEGKNGMIVPPKNADALFFAMQIMIQSPADRRMLADNARHMIATRFEQGYVRQCLYNFYEEIMNGQLNLWDELQSLNTEL